VNRAGARSQLPDAIACRVDWLEGSFGDRQFVGKALLDRDVVFHLASTTLPKSSNENPVFDVQTNLCSTIVLLEEAVNARVKKIIFPSSGGTVYGHPTILPIPEDHPTDPLSSYGITKLAIEKYLELFRLQYGLEYTVLRISNPFGPYHNPRHAQGVVGVFLSRVMEEKPIEIWGDGETQRDYIFIDDVIKAMLMVASSESGPRLFNVGCGEGRSLNQVIETVTRVTKRIPTIHRMPARSIDVPANVLDTSLIRSALGWRPDVDFETGVDRTYLTIKKRFES
jgi:UDP-glucose 4-epimerase